MKRLLILIFILPSFAIAQEKQLIIQGASPDLFINHTVAPKDNYYSIGRLYNISPKEIATVNNLQMDKGLSLGQIVKIPLTANNFAQNNTAAADEKLIPVYYVVKPKEGLYRVSTTNNKVSIPAIKQWNNLAGDEISTGAYLIVGHLKVKKELSSLAGYATSSANPIVEKQETNVESDTEKNIAANDHSTNNQTVVEEKNITAVETPAKKEEPVNNPVNENTGTNSDATSVVHKSVNFNGGVFKDLYQEKNEVIENGTAGIFKSTSGWEDGKYYCLHNAAQPQTIIKLTNNATGKSIYAKVMDVMPDIRQNRGIDILISNAAADQLGATDGKFDCTISYSK